MTPLLLASLLALDAPPPIDASTVRAVWLADLDPARVQPGPGRFVFVPGSATDVEATGRPGVLRTVRFGAGKTDEGLDIVAPVVLESVLAAGRAVGYTPPHRSPSVRAVPPMSEVTRILSAIEQGDPHAAAQLLPLVYDELRQLAAQNLAQERPGQTLQATALVHEAYLRLVGSEAEKSWDSRGHFFAAAVEAMRRILVEQARRRRSRKHGGGRARQELDPDRMAAPQAADDLLALDEALTRLAETEPQVAQLVKLRYFAGLTIPEAATHLGIAPRTADAWWAYAKAWFQAALHDS